MTKQKRDKYTKTKTMIVSSRSFFGRKTEMEKQIEKWEELGWSLTHNRPIQGNKNKHELTFEYRMSDDEIASAKKWERFGSIGCLTLVVLAVIGSIINNNIKLAETAATQEYQAQLTQTGMAQAYATKQQIAMNETATATLWTPTSTPTPSDTPTATLTPTITNTPTITPTPSNTFTPTVTFTPSLTFTPSKTPTVTASATITDTPTPSDTPIPRTPTPKPATNAPPQTYYTTGNANVRSCPKTTCDIVIKLPAGDNVSVVGRVEGDAVGGNTVWRIVMIGGQEAYIHSSLVSLNAPAAKPVQAQVPVQSNQAQQQVVSTVPPNPPVSFVPNCSGEVYDCKDLTCGQMAIYWAACPGDPSGLDGSDNDGKYCESKCGG